MRVPAVVAKLHLPLLAVLLIYLALAVTASLRLPLSAGPDELAHFRYARFIALHHTLPLTPAERAEAGYKSDQPPLNAMLVALVYRGNLAQPPFIKVAHGEPRRHLANDGWVDQLGVTRYQDVLNTKDPWAGEILLWRTGRFLSIGWGLLTLAVIYRLVGQLLGDQPQRRAWATVATASVAFIPTFIFLTAVFSYEALLGLCLALYVWQAALIFQRPSARWLYFGAGLAAGAALLAKLGAMLIPVSLLLLVGLAGRQGRLPWRAQAVRLGLLLAGFVASAGWWFGYILFHLNRISELGLVAGLLAPIISGDGSDTASVAVVALASGGDGGFSLAGLEQWRGWATIMFNTMWTPFPKNQWWVVWLVAMGVVFVLLGLAWVWRRRQCYRLWLMFLALYVALFGVLPLARLVLIDSKTVAGQGQHLLFPVLAALAVALALGLWGWFPHRQGWLAGLIPAAGLLAWSLVHLWQIFPVVNPVPVKTVPPVLPPAASESNFEFENVTLAGYQLSRQIDGPALPVSLYWQARQFAAEDYRLAVTLTDAAGNPQSAWVGYTADGRYPSRAWEKGDIIRDDLALPLTGLTAGTYTVTVSLLANAGPLPALNGRTTLDLGQVQVQSPPAAETVRVWSGPVFQNYAAIVVTAPPGEPVTLVGPAGAVYQPHTRAGAASIFAVDPLWPRGEYRVQASGGSSAALTIAGEARQSQLPPSSVPVQANFAGYIGLLGYDLPQKSVTAGADIPLIIQWQALQTNPADFMMFVRVRDEQGRAWGGRDRWPRESYSTLLWAAGEVLEDGFSVRVAPDAPAGTYFVDVGFYLMVGEAPVSLPLVENGQMGAATSVSLGPIQVNLP